MSAVVGVGFVRAGEDESVNVHPEVASVQVSTTFGATNTADNDPGVAMTWVALLTVVLRNDPADVKADRLNVYFPGVTPVDVAVFPVIVRLGTVGLEESENVHPVVASVHARLIVDPVATAVKLAGGATI